MSTYGFMFYFTPLLGFFSPFPRGTYTLSVTQEYLALRGGPRGFTRDFTGPMLLGIKTKNFEILLLDLHHLRYNFQLFHFFANSFYIFPTTPINFYWFRLFPFRSPLLWKSLLLSIPLATKMFQFARLLPFSIMNLREGTKRLPYSGISESMFVLNSSELFAVAHALHHLWVPRYPPNAFVLFNFYWIF